MLILGPLGFLTPWILAALAVLPVLWIILRAMPPSPRLQDFPGVGLLLGLRDPVPVARRTPWWLLLLRLAAMALLILAFAGPVWKPVLRQAEPGPLLIVMDAGWAAAPGWAERQARAERALQDAAADGRPAALLMADGQQVGTLAFSSAGDLQARLRATVPMAWETRLPDNPAEVLADQPEGRLNTLWIADGLDHPNRTDWLTELTARGSVTVVPPSQPLRALTLDAGDTPSLTLHSLDDGAPDILAIGPDPQGIQRELARLTPGAAGADNLSRPVVIDLPSELRNRITRFQIEGDNHAGAVVLADDRVRRRKVGLVGDAASAAEGQQLLSPVHYLRRALAPTTDLAEGGLGDVLDTAPDVIILADQLLQDEAPELSEWVDQGGLLIRFAGPRMAAYEQLTDEPLLPVRLRSGGRDIGGALSWGDPRGLAPFEGDGIFAGLTPPDDVTIRAQLMAQPAPDLAQRTIASLSDDTPLVTRAPQGQGQLVLFHITANATWSNLPISGLFVQMLDRLIASAQSSNLSEQPAQDRDEAFWTPETILDGFGSAEGPGDLAPVAGDELALGAGPGHPAGIYVAGERHQALNAGAALVPAAWPGAVIEDTTEGLGRNLTGWLLAAAAVLLALDAIGSAWLGGGRGRRRASARGAATAGLIALLLVLPQPGAMAQQAQPPAANSQIVNPELLRAANQVALAYVITGDDQIDETSRQGLDGLSRALFYRSSVEPGEPVGIDLDADDLSMLTFLYWPVTEGQPMPSPLAYLRLNHFLRSGGMILFDTRDGDLAGVGGPDMSATLQTLAAPLEIPPLAPVPEDHVLTRAFYLLDDFPGRWRGRTVWVEAPPAGAEAAEGVPFRNLNDGVTPVVIGANSWAEAWAVDPAGMPRFPVGRGFEGEEQREMAIRFGVNLIMYVLTGNYKSDQVHVPALLDRLRSEEVMP
ncbi:DUF4159 domain-containing protein [Paracoccus tegillarcae]|uniref:LytTR family transcriptional regulator n=1 Tax=Paracoccus tegillarcae TaxID=1529068 RepID=A0A2K9EIQ6_9RHOB|nr:DUF4159 domain-containing protein [Paracoccus tegillarcae]AUH34873.1 LytTR family transcriptional regulator [Paracoccus tegillarcae]